MPREIAVVIPTIRDESYATWEEAWGPLLDKHDVCLIKVRDGEVPVASVSFPASFETTAKEVLGDDQDLVINYSPACCALGFAIIGKLLPDIKYIIKLDDDLAPIGDPIQDHVDALNMYVPASWFPTASPYMRGFPYEVRKERPVYLSHGVWEGIPDLDAASQLVNGPRPSVHFYTGPLPMGLYTPISGMNVAFRRELLPYVYWCPAKLLPGAGRFDDIWTFLYTLREMWSRDWAAVTGYARVQHERASNVYRNLVDEAVGIGVNECLWKYLERSDWHVLPDSAKDFFLDFEKRQLRWESLMSIQ